MKPFDVNKITIDGDRNITVQNVHDSTVIVDTGNLKEIRQMLEELHSWQLSTFSNTINMFVIASTQARIAQLKHIDTSYWLPRYGEQPKDWKPYHNAGSIVELIQEFHQKSGFRLTVFFIDRWMIDDELILANLRDDISPQTILIADALSLRFEKNQRFASLFDRAETGGCLFPICSQHTVSAKNEVRATASDVFPHLYTCFNQRFNRQYINIEMEIPTKEKFFRRLTNIAVKHLDIRPLPKVKWHKRFLKDKDIVSFSHLKSGLE